MAAVVPSYKGFRYPMEIISHCLWLYHRFPLSFAARSKSDAGARRRGLTRDDLGVAPEVRADLRERTAPPTATSRG